MNYELSDWHFDFRRGFELVAGHPVSQWGDSLRVIFEKKYPDDPLADDKFDRLSLALLFLHNNIDTLNRRHGVVISKDGTLISNQLIGALYRIYAALPPEKLSWNLDPHWVLDLADEEYQNYQN